MANCSLANIVFDTTNNNHDQLLSNKPPTNQQPSTITTITITTITTNTSYDQQYQQ